MRRSNLRLSYRLSGDKLTDASAKRRPDLGHVKGRGPNSCEDVGGRAMRRRLVRRDGFLGKARPCS